ncbi:hypothetical protein F4808DRAFT_444585 [Astrocystis sublimbata]|nr:hypothetical protein F4808DRAFT_444585 [Astrocystis sublimbata]
MDQFADRALVFANNLSGHACHFLFDTRHRPYSGGECIVFVLDANGQRIGVRMEQTFSQATRVKVEREVQLLEAIRREQIDHLPSLIGYDLDSTPPMIATGWADGHKLEWTEFTPAQPFRNNILKTVAKVTLDLLRIQESGGSALKWVADKIIRTRITRSTSGFLPGISVDDCETLYREISKYHLSELDDAPHVLIHGDLHPSNIIVEEGEVKCIVDLGSAAVVPLQFSTYYPRFLINEPRLDGHIFDWSHCGYSDVQKADRAFYMQTITNMAPQMSKQAQQYAEIMTHDNQEDRHWWLSAVSRLDIMRALKTKPSPLHGGEDCSLEGKPEKVH